MDPWGFHFFDASSRGAMSRSLRLSRSAAPDAGVRELPLVYPSRHDPQRLERCGNWQLMRLVADGQLTQTYQAKPVFASASPGVYALKILKRHWEDCPEAAETMRRAAQASHDVSDPRLSPVLTAHTAASPYFLVMPWIAGETLETQLRRAGGEPPFGLAKALWFARQTAEGLAALHHAGWLHGDVKPGNLLISAGGRLTLLDLGFARRLHEPPPGHPGDTLPGTAQYMAPELFTAAGPGDVRSDIYSLGITLFELITGRPPFRAQTVGELIRQHRDALPRSVRNRQPTVPLEVDRLIQRMIAKQPLRRPHSAKEVVERLVDLEIRMLTWRN